MHLVYENAVIRVLISILKVTIFQTITSPPLKIQPELQPRPTPPRAQNPSSPDEHICYTYILAPEIEATCAHSTAGSQKRARAKRENLDIYRGSCCIYLKGTQDSAAKRASRAPLRAEHLNVPPKEFAERVNRAAAAVFRLCHRCIAVRQRRRRNAPRAPLEMPVW